MLTALALLLACPSIARGTRVTIRVLNVGNAYGIVRVALCRETEWVKHNCSFGGQQHAAAGIVEISLDVPPGMYGVIAHHDANADNQVNRNAFGIPLEGVGFSRDAAIRFGFPPFTAACVPIAGDAAFAAVTLSFEPHGASPNEK